MNNNLPSKKPSFLYLVNDKKFSIGITAEDVAYKAGQCLKNNIPDWYQGELGLFDNYIIPLAKKLKNCRAHLYYLTYNSVKIVRTNLREKTTYSNVFIFP
jgi:hypothetical protein